MDLNKNLLHGGDMHDRKKGKRVLFRPRDR